MKCILDKNLASLKTSCDCRIHLLHICSAIILASQEINTHIRDHEIKVMSLKLIYYTVAMMKAPNAQSIDANR